MATIGSNGSVMETQTGPRLRNRLNNVLHHSQDDDILTALKPTSEVLDEIDNEIDKSMSLVVESSSVRRDSFWTRTMHDWMYEPENMIQGLERKIKDPHRIHRHADSFFSTSSGFTNYRGLLNLCLILLVLSNMRLVLENIIKYGILANPIDWIHLFLEQPYSWPNILIILCMNIFILLAYSFERLFCKIYWYIIAVISQVDLVVNFLQPLSQGVSGYQGLLSERLGCLLQAINVAILLLYPAIVIYVLHPNPIFSVACLGVVTIVFLKLVSYACVNKWCREELKEEAAKKFRRRKSHSMIDDKEKIDINGDLKSNLVSYPDNLTINDLYYFLFAPTLIYELNFPRSARIRKRFLVKRFIEMIFLSQLMLALTQQWMIPTVNNAMKPLAELDIYRVVERLLKLAIPNHFIWLIFFYWFFHSTLNVVAEVLRFGDREFYKDWWNAETVSRFWQDWNIPVHRWASRHLYKPLMRYGCSKLTGSIMVFFLSAFFHEYLLSVPLRMFKVWAFSAMIGQVPLAYVTAKYKCLQGTMGNVIMWLSLIMGQPVAILAYVHDYYIINFGTLHNQTISVGH